MALSESQLDTLIGLVRGQIQSAIGDAEAPAQYKLGALSVDDSGRLKELLEALKALQAEQCRKPCEEVTVFDDA